MTALPARPWPALRLSPGLALSAVLGAGIGLMPATSDLVPVLFILLALASFWIEPGPLLRRNLPLVAPLLAYLAVQLAFNLYHGSVQAGDGYAQSNLQQIVMTLLILRLFSLSLLHSPTMVFSAVVTSFIGIAIVFWDFYTGGTSPQSPMCRPGAYSGNAQWVSAFQVLVTAAMLIYWHRQRLRFPIVIYALAAAILVSIGALSSARMAFYAFVLFLVLYAALLALARHYAVAMQTLGAGLLGVGLTFAAASISSCNFEDRVIEQFQLAPKVWRYISGGDPAVDRVLGKPTAAPPPAQAQSPAQPVPIILFGLRLPHSGASGLAPDASPPHPQDLHLAQDTAAGAGDEELAQQVIAAGASRAQMWKNALDAIALAPFAGYGQAAEVDLVRSGYVFFAEFSHFHNQYLSWLIWSGVAGLAAGLYFIASLALHGPDRRLGAAFFGILAMVMASETLLLPFNLNVVIVIYIFYLHLARGAAQRG